MPAACYDLQHRKAFFPASWPAYGFELDGSVSRRGGFAERLSVYTDTLRSVADQIAMRLEKSQAVTPDRNAALISLYEKGEQQQWSADDLDWTMSNSFGEYLPVDSAFALNAFDRSPLGRYGRSVWNTFRWEFHAWMASQFLPGEQAALAASSRLAAIAPDIDARLCLATQVRDEQRHVEVFQRYIRDCIPVPYATCPSLAALLGDTLRQTRWDMMELGTHILIETVALAAFRLANWTFHDLLAREICRRIVLDEARHVSIGVLSLRPYYKDLSEPELREREEFALDAVELIRRRFLFEDIWERMGVDKASALAFAQGNPLVVQYRRTVSARLASNLAKIGLLTERIKERFAAFDEAAVRTSYPE